MKTLTKLIWGLFSTAICVMYKLDAFGACTLTLMGYQQSPSSTYWSNTWGQKYTNAAYNAYADYYGLSSGYLGNSTDEFYTTNAWAQTTLYDSSSLCGGVTNGYVYSCSSGGPVIYNPSDLSTYEQKCNKHANVRCKACPTHGTVNGTTGKTFSYNTYQHDYNGFYLPVQSTSLRPINASGSVETNSGQAVTLEKYSSGIVAAFMLYITCDSEYSLEEDFATIEDCYVKTTITDTTGTYKCPNDDPAYPHYKN